MKLVKLPKENSQQEGTVWVNPDQVTSVQEEDGKVNLWTSENEKPIRVNLPVETLIQLLTNQD